MKRLSWLLVLALMIGLAGPAAAEDEKAPPKPDGEPEEKKAEAKPPKPEPRRRGRRDRRLVVPDGVTAQRDLVYAKIGERELRLDLYKPTAEGTPPLVVWVHGGGWRRGDKSNCRLLWLAAEGYAVASVEYRLSGEAKFPAQIYDVKGAVRWLRANAKRLGYDATKVGIGGSSAGGHLAALMGTSGGVKSLEGDVGGNLEHSSRVDAVYDMFGPSHLATMADGHPDPARRLGATSPEGQLLGGAVAENAEKAKGASPTTYVTADDPPFLIAHGDKDRLVPLSQSTKLDALLDAVKVPSDLLVRKGAGHGGRNFEGPDLRAAIKVFFKKHLKAKAPVTTPSAGDAK